MKEKIKILLADDEKDLAKAVATILTYSNYNVDVVNNGKEAIEKINNKIYDLMILDIMMPVMDGIQVLKELRKNNIKTPVILLTAKSQVDDKVEGLDSGANDYLTKPFDKKELLARIRALTRIKEENEEKYEVGNIVFDKETSVLSSKKASLHLNNKECEIMEILVKNQERNISKKELKNRIWVNEKNDDNIVTMYISYLQEKFSVLGANMKISYKNGYVLEKL